MESQAPGPVLRAPATFAERGVYFTGTTPALTGARVRRGVDGLEFVLPNPANGRGVYILRWQAVRDTLQPTLHDILLHNAIRAASAVTPATMRAAARQVALDGAAGREARAAALHQAEADVQARSAASRHAQFSRAGGPPLSEPLLDLLMSVGVGPSADGARLPRLVARLQAMSAGGWAAGDGAAAAMASAVDGAVAGASILLVAAQVQARNIGALLDAWAAAPGSLSLAISRPGWFLDGWELPCLAWEDGPAAALDVCSLMPVLPTEAAGWTARPVPATPWVDARSAGTDWRAGLSALDWQARNERFRALAA